MNKTRILIVVLCLPVLGVLYGAYAWKDPFYHRTITGKVVSEGARWARVQGDTGQKYAILLKPFKAEHPEEAEISDGAVECLSTRCALLQSGMCVDFSCRIDHRLLEPSVVQCKMEKQVECGPAGFAN